MKNAVRTFVALRVPFEGVQNSVSGLIVSAKPRTWFCAYKQKALSILQVEAGHQFDPALVDAFVQLGQQRRLSPIMGHSDEGIPLRACPMCGPTLVIRREQAVGERIYCRNCSGEFELTLDNERQLQATPTGNAGSAKDLEPEADTALIARTVRGIVVALPISGLLKQNHRAVQESAVP